MDRAKAGWHWLIRQRVGFFPACLLTAGTLACYDGAYIWSGILFCLSGTLQHLMYGED